MNKEKEEAERLKDRLGKSSAKRALRLRISRSENDLVIEYLLDVLKELKKL